MWGVFLIPGKTNNVNYSRPMKYFKCSQMLQFHWSKTPTICIGLDVVVLLHILQLELLWNIFSVQETSFIISCCRCAASLGLVRIVAKGFWQMVESIKASDAFLDTLVFLRRMKFTWTMKENKIGYILSFQNRFGSYSFQQYVPMSIQQFFCGPNTLVYLQIAAVSSVYHAFINTLTCLRLSTFITPTLCPA